ITGVILVCTLLDFPDTLLELLQDLIRRETAILDPLGPILGHGFELLVDVADRLRWRVVDGHTGSRELLFGLGNLVVEIGGKMGYGFMTCLHQGIPRRFRQGVELGLVHADTDGRTAERYAPCNRLRDLLKL